MIFVGVTGLGAAAYTFSGADRAEFGDPSSGFEVLAIALLWIALFVRLWRAEVVADRTGIHSRAVLTRFIPATDIATITIRMVPHGIYAPYPLAPYVRRRNGKLVKLTPMERLDMGSNSQVLDAECDQLMSAVGIPRTADDAGR